MHNSVPLGDFTVTTSIFYMHCEVVQYKKKKHIQTKKYTNQYKDIFHGSLYLTLTSTLTPNPGGSIIL